MGETREALLERMRLLEEMRRLEQPAVQGGEVQPSTPSIGESDFGSALLQGRPGEFLRERVRLLRESPEFRERIGRSTRRNVGTAAAVGGAALASPFAAATGTSLLGAEALTAMSGEAARQGITGERSPIDLILAGGLPSVFRGLFTTGRAVLRQGKRLPGAAAALTDDAIARGRALLERLKPTELESLRGAAQALDNLDVPLKNFQRVARELQTKAAGLAPRLQPREAVTIANQLDDLVEATQTKALPLRQLRDNLQEIGAEVGRLRRATADRAGLTRNASANLNALRKVYKSVLDDLDALPADSPRVLTDLRQALRNNFAALDLERVIEQNIDTRSIDALQTINARSIRRAWRKGRDSQFLQESFTPTQRAEIDAWVNELTRLPALPTPRGVNAGSLMLGTRTLGAGGIATGVTGDPITGAMVGGIAALAPRAIAFGMTTRSGRAMLRAVLSERGFVTPQVIQQLAVASRLAPAVQARIQGRPAAPAQSIFERTQGALP